MANWNESEYVRRAGDIAREFTTTKRPLNDLCEKVARDEALNPDEIRTLVRLSNVAAFQQIFKDKAGAGDPDRMVEFDVGNPEAVVQRIQSSVESPPQSANIHNDKLAFEVPDQMREIRLGRKFDVGTTKVASDVPERAPRKDLAVLAARKLAREMEIGVLEAGNRWESRMNKLATEFRRAPGYGPSWDLFVKSAFAEFGEGARPELEALATETRHPAPLPGTEKVAELQARFVTEDSAELTLLKQALDARAEYVKLEAGAALLAKYLPRA